MTLRLLFLIGAIVLVVLAIIGAASTSGDVLSVQWPVWLAASLLSYFASIVVSEIPGRPVA
jgi:hypothetical protein